MKKNRKYYIRRVHRFLGVLIGIQFMLWTVSGLYFSWSNIDYIHGDQYLKDHIAPEASGLLGPGTLIDDQSITSLELRFIAGQPYYWINNHQLYNAYTGESKDLISRSEAIEIVKAHISKRNTIRDAELITEVGKHHEYRGHPLPTWAVNFDEPSDLVAYVSAKDGSFQRVRHSSWRVFDFLWMFHTMDYQGRDDFNNILLRSFSLFGLITVLSGFLLYFSSSKRFKRLGKMING